MSEILVFVLELIGTAAFAVSGAIVGIKKQMDLFGVIVLGVCTAVGGGVLRDVFSGERPYIFVRHFYACASIAGAIVCVGLWKRAGANLAMLLGAALVVILRLLAAHYRWSLPKSDYSADQTQSAR